MKIFVRFGHDTLTSGSFTGAAGSTLSEKEVIDQYAPYLAEVLYHAGHEVRTYGHTDRVYSVGDDALLAGINAANTWGAQLFVSCHANSFNSTASYSMCYYRNDPLSIKLANAVSTAASSTLGISNSGGVDGSTKAETKTTYMNMPSIIIEPLFVSNPSDCAKFTSVGGRALGVALANAILTNI